MPAELNLIPRSGPSAKVRATHNDGPKKNLAVSRAPTSVRADHFQADIFFTFLLPTFSE
jgi:hypothetical protein